MKEEVDRITACLAGLPRKNTKVTQYDQRLKRMVIREHTPLAHVLAGDVVKVGQSIKHPSPVVRDLLMGASAVESDLIVMQRTEDLHHLLASAGFPVPEVTEETPVPEPSVETTPTEA